MKNPRPILLAALLAVLAFLVFWFVKGFAPVLRNPVGTFAVVAPLGLVGIGLALARRRNVGLLLAFGITFMLSVVPFFLTARYRLAIVLVLAATAWAAWAISPLWHHMIHPVPPESAPGATFLPHDPLPSQHRSAAADSGRVANHLFRGKRKTYNRENEAARRRRQIEFGELTRSNGLQP